MASTTSGDARLKRTPLHPLHVALSAKMVPFAGYDMPVQFSLGVMGEHRHCRDQAGLFDVSHMGQVELKGPDHETVAGALETLVPGEIRKLGEGRMRYSLLLNDEGGILDDLMISRPAGEDGTLLLVVNAACKDNDIAHLKDRLPDGITVTPRPDLALVALQGPKAAEVFARHCPDAAELKFMRMARLTMDGVPVTVSRSGYTGEDGFEISMPEAEAPRLTKALLDEPEVEAIGLGARDSLRLEAGLCLYGHDLDETTTPVEGALEWAIGKRRRQEGGFPGAERIRAQLKDGAARRRVGITLDGRAPAREGTQIVDAHGTVIGKVTSGTVGPTAGTPVAMGYVESEFAETGTPLGLMIRGVRRDGRVADTPFVPQRYYRG